MKLPLLWYRLPERSTDTSCFLWLSYVIEGSNRLSLSIQGWCYNSSLGKNTGLLCSDGRVSVSLFYNLKVASKRLAENSSLYLSCVSLVLLDFTSSCAPDRLVCVFFDLLLQPLLLFLTLLRAIRFILIFTAVGETDSLSDISNMVESIGHGSGLDLGIGADTDMRRSVSRSNLSTTSQVSSQSIACYRW